MSEKAGPETVLGTLRRFQILTENEIQIYALDELIAGKNLTRADLLLILSTLGISEEFKPHLEDEVQIYLTEK